MKQKNGKRTYGKQLSCLFLLAAILFTSLTVPTSAADSYAHAAGSDKMITVVNSNSSLQDSYAFTPRVNKKTVVTAGGTALKGSNDSAAMSNCSKTDILSTPCYIFAGEKASDFSDCWIKYANVGTWYDASDQAHIVDIKITVNSVSFAKTDKGQNFPYSFAARKDAIAVLMSRYGRMKMTLGFYEHGTNKALNLSGHFNIADVDVNQGVLMDKKNVKQYYVYKDTGSVLKVNTKGYASGYVFYSDNSENFSSGMKKAMVAESFSGPSVSFYYYGKYRPGSGGTAKSAKATFQEIYGNVSDSRWQHYYDLCKRAYQAKDYTGYNLQDANSKYDGGMFMNTFFELSADAPMAQNMPDPVKTVNVSKADLELNQAGDTSKDLQTAVLGMYGNDFYYNIYQYVPLESLAEFRYEKLEITDQLKDFLQTSKSGCKVYNENGVDVTKYFDTFLSGQQVCFRAKKEYLAGKGFYGHTYKFRIPCKVKTLQALRDSEQKKSDSTTSEDGVVTETYSWENTAKRQMIRAGKSFEADTKMVLIKTTRVQNPSIVQLIKCSEPVFSEAVSLPIAGVEFHIWSEDAGFDKTLLTDESGNIWLSGLKPGIYYYQETKAADGYVKDDSVKQFEVDQDGLINGKVKEIFEIKNDPIQIRIQKKDAATGRLVEGAELTLKDASGKTWFTFVSGKQPQQIARIPAGNYELVETKAPAGYALADPVPVVIKESSELQDFVMENIPYADLTVTKKIKYADVTFAHGNPIVPFTVSGRDLFGNYHAYSTVLEFTEDMKPDTGGYLTLSYTFRHIPAGIAYDVKEHDVLRYRLKNVTSSSGNVVIQKQDRGTFSGTGKKGFRITADLQKN